MLGRKKQKFQSTLYVCRWKVWKVWKACDPSIRSDIDSPRGEKIWGRRVGWDPLLHFSGLWGCPGEVIYVGATFVRTSRARAPRKTPFWGVNVYSAPREVASLVVTRQ